jgi:tetratricopeptide (TPR) repeat protein
VLDYGTAIVTSLTAVWWQAALIVTLLVGTAWALVRRPALGFVGACFFLILAPSSSFVPLVTQTIAEHRMYLPLAAVIAALALAAHRWLGSSAIPILFAAALVAGGVTFARNRIYASEIAIWEGNVSARPHARVLTALGVAQLHAGRPVDALPHFTRALALDPTHLAAQRNRALALLQLGRGEEAAAILRTLPAREPGEAAEYFGLGNAFAREQKYAEAAAAYTRVVTLEPAHVAAHANLGNVLLLQGRVREAIAEYEIVLRLRPDDVRARENLQVARDALR